MTQDEVIDIFGTPDDEGHALSGRNFQLSGKQYGSIWHLDNDYGGDFFSVWPKETRFYLLWFRGDAMHSTIMAVGLNADNRVCYQIKVSH
jgi:hypothetical protein